MEYRLFGKRYFIRLDPGDRLLTSLLALCEREGVSSAVFSGIGACGETHVAHYTPETGEFHDHPRTGLLEIASLNGSVVRETDGSLTCHAHAIFSTPDERGELTLFGGHLLEATVSLTAELWLDPVEGDFICRRMDPATGVKIWRFPGEEDRP